VKKFKTAVYTILKNEKKFIEKWLYYAQPFDYRVLLDTGSTDGSWELLQEYAKTDENLIIEQKSFTPWRFDIARRYNLSMIPKEVEWCLSPDLDEYFSINTYEQMHIIINSVPNITNISCDRLDIYSKTVRVGPPNFIGTNKIHLRADYTWNQPIYEHLSWIHKDREELELYSEEIFLIHDQDFKKKERSELYIKMMEDEYASNPTNTWNLWYLIYHYRGSQQIEKYIPAACLFLQHHNKKNDAWYKQIHHEMTDIFKNAKLTLEMRQKIFDILKDDLL